MLIRSTQSAFPHSQTRSSGSAFRSNVSARSSIRSLTSRKTASLSPIRSSRAPIRRLASLRLFSLDVDVLLDDDVTIPARDDPSERPLGVLVPGHGEEVPRIRPHAGVLV